MNRWAVAENEQKNQRPKGTNQYSDGNNVPKRPEGNSAAKALRRLRKDRPDLHKLVLEGKLSANKAMIEAGFRVKTSVELESASRCAPPSVALVFGPLQNHFRNRCNAAARKLAPSNSIGIWGKSLSALRSLASHSPQGEIMPKQAKSHIPKRPVMRTQFLFLHVRLELTGDSSCASIVQHVEPLVCCSPMPRMWQLRSIPS
jgi:hypothetical protein